MSVDLEKNKIFRKLSQRQQVGWSMSFDNVGKRFEYVRHGGDWELLKHNLAAVKELMTNQGHWGGIHAVYNIYSATRICELRQFAEETKTTVLWQNLFQPDYLDPFRHGPDVAAVAAKEIEEFYSTGQATEAERQFFDQALASYKTIKNPQLLITQQFAKHIREIETQYHTDKQGQFAQLWPELNHLCK